MRLTLEELMRTALRATEAVPMATVLAVPELAEQFARVGASTKADAEELLAALKKKLEDIESTRRPPGNGRLDSAQRALLACRLLAANDVDDSTEEWAPTSYSSMTARRKAVSDFESLPGAEDRTKTVERRPEKVGRNLLKALTSYIDELLAADPSLGAAPVSEPESESVTEVFAGLIDEWRIEADPTRGDLGELARLAEGDDALIYLIAATLNQPKPPIIGTLLDRLLAWEADGVTRAQQAEKLTLRLLESPENEEARRLFWAMAVPPGIDHKYEDIVMSVGEAEASRYLALVAQLCQLGLLEEHRSHRFRVPEALAEVVRILLAESDPEWRAEVWSVALSGCADLAEELGWPLVYSRLQGSTTLASRLGIARVVTPTLPVAEALRLLHDNSTGLWMMSRQLRLDSSGLNRNEIERYIYWMELIVLAQKHGDGNELVRAREAQVRERDTSSSVRLHLQTFDRIFSRLSDEDIESWSTRGGTDPEAVEKVRRRVAEAEESLF